MEEIVNAIPGFIEALTPLAEKVGAAGIEMFGWFVKRAYAEAITPILAIIAVVIGCKIASWAWKQEQESHDDDYAVPGVIGLGTVLFGLICFFATLKSATQAVIAPEAWALIEILKMVN